MSEIEKVKRYIQEPNIPKDVSRHYTIRIKEGKAIGSLPRFDAILLAFFYGEAKGYRAAKAEARRG